MILKLVNLKLLEDVKAIGVPALKIAKKHGVGKAANTVMLGVLNGSFNRPIRGSF